MGASVRVMTFNIRHGSALDGANRWGRRRDLVVSVLERHAPDVIGAQEVNPGQLAALLSSGRYGVVRGRRYAGGPFGTTAPVLFDRYRFRLVDGGGFWLAPDPDGPRVRAWDAAVPRTCTWAVLEDEGTRFAVLNSHFDQRGEEARRRSAELVAARVAGLAPLACLFCADLNANERSEPYRILVGSGMRDAFSEAGPHEGPTFTFHAFRGTASRGSLGRIDHILYSGPWQASAAAIVRDGAGDRWPSDHFPVTATLRLEPGEGPDPQVA